MTKASLFDWDVYTGHEPAGWTACGVTATEKLAVERVRTTFAAMPYGTCAWAEIIRVRLDPAHLAPRERLEVGRHVAVRLWDGGVVWSLPRRRVHALRRPIPRRPPAAVNFLDDFGGSASPPHA
ncbi:hypothetical protein ACOZ38_39890 [Sphaerisporangium viridialbum]|uniref:hypothetical protein n=1 Tax=Sphaerisporangium viridialbum TaxID=46189 RepID=UPI003C77337A